MKPQQSARRVANQAMHEAVTVLSKDFLLIEQAQEAIEVNDLRERYARTDDGSFSLGVQADL